MITSRLTTTIALEAACNDDFAALARLRVSALRESLERIGRFDEAQVVATLRDTLAIDHTQHILVEGARIGFVTLRPTADGLLLDHLYLDPAHQRKGVGTVVVQHAIATAVAGGVPLWAGVLRASAANRFYLRHGFRQVSEDAWDIYYVHVCSGRTRRPA